MFKQTTASSHLLYGKYIMQQSKILVNFQFLLSVFCKYQEIHQLKQIRLRNLPICYDYNIY